MKQIRSILEFAVPVWHSSLTGVDRLNIERIQKSAIHISLGDDYLSYNSALNVMNLETLFRRIQKLCTEFAKNCMVSDKFKKWFNPILCGGGALRAPPCTKALIIFNRVSDPKCGF